MRPYMVFTTLSVTILFGGNMVWGVRVCMVWWHFYDMICMSTCSLPSILAWILTLWSVVVFVCGIVTFGP